MELSVSIILLMFLGIFVTPTVNYWVYKQRFNYNYKSLVLFIVIKSVLNVLSGVYLVCNVSVGNQAKARVISMVLWEAIAAIVLYVTFAKKAGRFFSTKKWKETLIFQLPLIPHFLSMNFLFSSDRIMIQKLIGAAQAGIYSVAYSAGQIMNILETCIVDAMRPWIYEKLNKKEYHTLAKLTNTITVLVMLLSFAFSAVAPEIIRILASAQYYDAIYVVPPVALSSLFTFVYQIFMVIETYYGKTTKIMKASMIAAITNLALNYFAIPIFGYVAAGYTTIISYMLLSAFHYKAIVTIQKEEKIEKFFEIKSMVATALFAIIACIAVSFLYKYMFVRYTVIVSFAIITVISRKKLLKIIDQLKN
jgi:O-antigen/teichoic acid export membrane protein